MLRIGYRKKHLNINLVLGIAFFTLGIIGVVIKDNMRWTDYGYFAIAILYLALHFYQKKYKYLTINNGMLKINDPFGKEVKLKEIKQVKKFAGDYIIKTDLNEMTVNTQVP